MGKVSTKGKWLLGATKVDYNMRCVIQDNHLLLLDHHIWLRHPRVSIRICQEGQEQEEGSEERQQQEAGGQAAAGQDLPEKAGGGLGQAPDDPIR